MSGRSILNQSITGRNILNIKTKNLQDGKAIKISDRHAINVDMKTNTTEQTTVGDTDLFLLSDTTGKTIKYITGSNLSAAVTGDIVAGTNLNKAGSTLNLDTGLTSMVSIDGGANDLKLRRSGNDKITLETAKVKFNTNTSTLGAALGLTMGSGGQTNNADYELKQEYLASGFRTNKYDAGVRFQRFLTSTDAGGVTVNSNFTQLLCGYQEDEGQCVVINPNEDLHYVFRPGGGPFSGVLKIRKPDDSAHNFSMDMGNAASTFTMSSLTNAIFDCDTFTCASSRLVAKKSNDILYLFNNATLPVAIGNNNEWLQQYGDGSLLKLRGTTIKLLSTTNEIISLDNTAITCNRKIGMNNNPINLGGPSDANHQILYSGSGMNGVLIRGFGFGGTPFFRATTSDGDTPILECFKLKVVIHKLLGMEQQPINLYASTDTNHQILFSNSSVGSAVGQQMNGVLIRGFGNADPFFRLQGTSPASPVNVLDAYIDKVRFLKTLELDQNRLDFTSSGFHYMEFSNTNMDGILLAAFGNAGVPLFRVQTTNSSSNSTTLFDIASIDPDITGAGSGYGATKVYHKLSVVRNNATLQDDENDIFTVRNTGFCKSLIHSDTAEAELALRTTSNFFPVTTRQATIVFTQQDQLKLNVDTQGKLNFFRGTTQVYNMGATSNGQSHTFSCGGTFDANNGGNFIVENSLGQLYFQNDRNFVIYRSSPYSGVAFTASSNDNSSRDYKDNIVDLDANESIEIIKGINPVSFTYKPAYWDKTDDCNNCGCKRRRGFIWEDVKPFLPTACRMIKHKNDEGNTKMLSKDEMVPDLVKTVQFLLAKVEAQATELTKLSAKLEDLRVAQYY